jgi:hypothetical protein
MEGVVPKDDCDDAALPRSRAARLFRFGGSLPPRGMHDPSMFIKLAELRAAMQRAGLVPGATSGLGPRGVNRRLDLVVGPLLLLAVLCKGIAQKPAAGGRA